MDLNGSRWTMDLNLNVFKMGHITYFFKSGHWVVGGKLINPLCSLPLWPVATRNMKWKHIWWWPQFSNLYNWCIITHQRWDPPADHFSHHRGCYCVYSQKKLKFHGKWIYTWIQLKCSSTMGSCITLFKWGHGFQFKDWNWNGPQIFARKGSI